MVHSSSGATTLLGMVGFVVGAQLEVDGELWLNVETTVDVVGCGECDVRAVGHGRRRVKVRDLPIAGRPVVLVWAKRIWRCPEPTCAVGTWTETTPAIRPRGSLTERARAEMCRRVGQDGDSAAAAARAFGVGWQAAMNAVRDHGQPLVDDPDRIGDVGAVGVDETKFLAGNQERRTQYVTGFVDLDQALLIDIVAGRSGKVVADWLDARPQEWLDGIGVVALDPHRGYANGLLVHLGHATMVVDHFHAIALANRAIDDVRRRIQNDTLGHRGRKGDPLYGIRRLLLVGYERLTERGRDRLVAGLSAGDPEGAVGVAYLAKELLRETYGAVDAAHARRRLTVF